MFNEEVRYDSRLKRAHNLIKLFLKLNSALQQREIPDTDGW